jgi:outer membrane protein TolC
MTRMMRRWTARLLAGGVLALAGSGVVGCKHQLFTEPADSPLLRRRDIPPQLEEQPHQPIFPASAQVGTTPANVLDLKRAPRFISLKEAIAIAVEQGNTGGQGGTGQDATSNLATNGRNPQTDSVKAFVLDPALAAAEVERSLSKFDARWITSMSWSKQDQATLTLQQSFSNGDSAAFSSTLAKPLPTGGVAGITTSVNYQKLSNPPPANTGFVTLTSSYSPRVQFVFEQPLLQGFGVEANQLLPNHPGSLLIQGFRSTGQGTEGILLTRIRAEQAREQFNERVNAMLVNVELAYWNLYAAYRNLAAREDGLKAAFKALDFNTPRVEQGLEEPQLRPQLEQQYWTFYAQVIEARGQVLEADRAFRGLLGMRSDDGTVFAPADVPTETPVRIDFRAAYEEGLQNRPEVLMARQELKAQQLNLRAQRYARMPDLRFFSSYDVNGLGGQLGGRAEDGSTSALSNLASNQFNSWQYGLRLDIPLGFRDANALVRQAQLNLWRSWYTLSDAERKVLEILTQAERQGYQAYQTILAQRKVRTSAKRRVDLIETRIVAGQFAGSGQYLQLTQAQQELANATAAEYRAIADYNSALARIEYAKGTIQRYNNISVADGPLPSFVQKKAADHFRERQVGLKLREHPADATGTGGLNGFEFAPIGDMTDRVNQAPPAAAPGGGAIPGLTPPVLMPPPGVPAPGSVKSWADWNNSRDGTGTSMPSTLPQPVAPPKTSGEPTGGTFVPNGSLTLPPKRPQGGEPPPSLPGSITPSVPSSTPTTPSNFPPLQPLPPIK